MSGLERFQGTSDFMQKIKSLLTINRDPTTPPRDLNSSEESSFGLELNEDFLNILGENKIVPSIMTTSFNMENKENMSPTSLRYSKESKSNNSQIRKISVCEDSIMNPSFIDGSANSFEITNFSFTAIEQACNKSLSDPDSTIHNYVEQIRKNNDSKNSNETENTVTENEAIDRLIKDLEAEELKYTSNEKIYTKFSKKSDRTTSTFADQTQLADVEEPSALWDTTVTDNNGKYISPTKMIGLLRPSTILEESSPSNASESNVTENSFSTAKKPDIDQINFESDSATSAYETACESVARDCNVALDKVDDKEKNIKETSVDLDPGNFSLLNLAENKSPSCHADALENFEISQNIFNNIINSQRKDEVSFDKIEIKKEKSFIKNQNLDHVLTIEISDDELDENSKNNIYHVENGLNEGFSIQDEQIDNINESDKFCEELNSQYDKRVSLKFNDTLEEVEYIMKRGMQMLDSGSKPKIVENVEIKPAMGFNKSPSYLKPKTTSPTHSSLLKFSTFSLNTTNKTTLSEKKKYLNSPLVAQKVFSPKGTQNTPPIKNSPLGKPIVKQVSTKKNPISTSKDIFKKPILGNNMTKIPQPKLLCNIKKSYYADVISPVGAYIKKTPVCPTESKIKETTVKSLDYGQATGKATLQYHPPKRFDKKKGNGPSLPQKCYKSAEYRCVVDERTPLNIPGGEKIHKYLKPALMPAIVRHDGKMKMGSPMKYNHEWNNASNKTVDSTMTDLAELSTISGDVSIYTLRDAQKFNFNVNGKNIVSKK